MDDFMATILNPSSGLCNPEKGFGFPYPHHMSGKTVKPIRTKKVSLAANVKRLMDVKYESSRNRPMSLAKDATVSLSSVQRAISGETAPTLDTLEAFAEVFSLTIGELVDGKEKDGVLRIKATGRRDKQIDLITDLLHMTDIEGLAVMLDRAKDAARDYPLLKETRKSST